MDKSEQDQFFARLEQLFPANEATPAMTGLWASRTRAFPLAACLHALDDHRIEQRNKKYPDLGTFLGRLAQLVRVSGEFKASEKFSAILRRQGIGGPGMNDHDVICEHYRRLWMKRSERNTVPVHEGTRNNLASGCRSHLFSEGCIDSDELEYRVGTIFDVVDVFA